MDPKWTHLGPFRMARRGMVNRLYEHILVFTVYVDMYRNTTTHFGAKWDG